ncbi:hypothetical protein D3C86_1655190 [compost metagenome]
MLMVARDQRNRFAQYGAAHLLDGQSGGLHRALARGVGGHARHVGEHPDFHAVSRTGVRGGGTERQAQAQTPCGAFAQELRFHLSST